MLRSMDPVGGTILSVGSLSYVIIRGSSPVSIRISNIPDRNKPHTTSSLPAANNASNTPFVSAPLTTPLRNISFVISGRSSSASMSSRSSSRVMSRRSASTRSSSAFSSNTAPNPDSTSLTISLPPSATHRLSVRPAATSAETTETSRTTSPVEPMRVIPARSAARARSAPLAPNAATSTSTAGPMDSNTAWLAFNVAITSGAYCRRLVSTWSISAGGTKDRSDANGSLFSGFGFRFGFGFGDKAFRFVLTIFVPG
mmetsp:Transcript_2005/g.9060  ORF Transcript_2005/g.9060 Transcript_2005/m.9060 type:complete len:256 (+) Transcript_2005:828-1595(+)